MGTGTLKPGAVEISECPGEGCGDVDHHFGYGVHTTEVAV